MFVSIRKIAILITINFLLVCSLSSQERKTTAIKKTPNVLIVHLVKGFGGGCQQTISVLKSLYKKRWNIRALVAEGSRLQETLKKLKLPYVSCKMRSFMQGKTLDQYLYKILLRICQKYKIDIIHCRKEHEYVAVKHVAKYLGIKAIAHYHSHEIPAAEKFKGFDAFLSSCPSVTEFIAKEANKKIHGIKHVGFMVPPHDEDKFLNFIPTQTKEDFFKQNFNICLKNVPLICVVAHFVAHKNHKLFLQAIHKLIYEKNIPVEVVLVGEGLLRNDLEELSKKLSLQKDVHFLGFSFKIPEILYYSDIKVLPSLDEAFGVVILEAALMKKPIILSQGVSLANVLIKHEQTGLLFDPMNANELVDQIMRLINNNDFAKQLGENSYNYVRKYFSAEASIEQHKSIYMTLYQEKIFN